MAQAWEWKHAEVEAWEWKHAKCLFRAYTPAMARIDFDLARYIAHRKGRVMQRARDGAAYGFSKELRHRRNLVALRPVAFAIDATSKRWKRAAKEELLAGATRASSAEIPRLYAAYEFARKSLGLEVSPPLYQSSVDAPVGAWALGTEDDALLVVHPQWVEALSDSELVAVVGRCLGYLQNNLVPYSTALYYLEHDAFFFVKWVVAPAVMALRAWSRRADITCDRAGLIACRNLGIATASLLRTSGDYHGPLDYEGLGNGVSNLNSTVLDSLAKQKELRQRLDALHIFSQTYLYSQLSGAETPDGMATDAADEAVAELLD